MPEFVVPARHVLTVLHRQDPDIPPVTSGPDPSDGMTLCCGRPMLVAETWVGVDRVTGDAVCGETSVPGEAGEDAVEVTLW
jgi:hypothetical protein